MRILCAVLISLSLSAALSASAQAPVAVSSAALQDTVAEWHQNLRTNYKQLH